VIVRVNGEEIRDTREQKQVVSFGSRGEILKLAGETDTKEAWSYGTMRTFVSPEKPVEIGGGWQFEYKPKGKFEGARISYTLKSVDAGKGVVEFHVNAAGRERPEIGGGTWTIDVKTGKWLELDGWMIGFLDEGEKATIKMKRN
jgi:hypothetical protein